MLEGIESLGFTIGTVATAKFGGGVTSMAVRSARSLFSTTSRVANSHKIVDAAVTKHLGNMAGKSSKEAAKLAQQTRNEIIAGRLKVDGIEHLSQAAKNLR
jgi:hypothetical protein